MKPNDKFITIKHNLIKINLLLQELVLQPRINAIKWSKITRQTPNIKIGYPGQHLVSLITGMSGEGTGGRGNDLIDGSEVKSCSRIDPLDKCQKCDGPVARLELVCVKCGSKNIKRSNDSKWLFGIKSEDDLNILTNKVQRIVLILADYPNFDNEDYDTLRFQSFEIWTNSDRGRNFVQIMKNYYNKIYLEHKKNNVEKNPAPKNFWPYQYQFYMCNPILTFSCIVTNANSEPVVEITDYVKPEDDRTHLPSVIMPASILSDEEVEIIFKEAKREELELMFKNNFKNMYSKIEQSSSNEKKESLIGIDEVLRSYLSLRDTDKISVAKNKYSRRVY